MSNVDIWCPVSWEIDSGHGWLRVPLSKYPDAINHGTGYGFHNKQAGIVYLEEDVEAGTFLLAHPEIDLNTIPSLYYGTGDSGFYEHSDDAYCRSLPHIPDNSKG
jgi:hypothetical protein